MLLHFQTYKQIRVQIPEHAVPAVKDSTHNAVHLICGNLVEIIEVALEDNTVYCAIALL